MKTTETGNYAEKAVCNYLKKLDYEVISRNWKTKWCEIDIIAKKQNVVWFVEVKYRKSSDQGSGLESITPKKLQQMTFAANIWINSHDDGNQYALGGAEVTGEEYEVTRFVEC